MVRMIGDDVAKGHGIIGGPLDLAAGVSVLIDLRSSCATISTMIGPNAFQVASLRWRAGTETTFLDLPGGRCQA